MDKNIFLKHENTTKITNSLTDDNFKIYNNKLVNTEINNELYKKYKSDINNIIQENNINIITDTELLNKKIIDIHNNMLDSDYIPNFSYTETQKGGNLYDISYEIPFNFNDSNTESISIKEERANKIKRELLKLNKEIGLPNTEFFNTEKK